MVVAAYENISASSDFGDKLVINKYFPNMHQYNFFFKSLYQKFPLNNMSKIIALDEFEELVYGCIFFQNSANATLSVHS